MRKLQSTKRLRFERLEPRVLLVADAVVKINEIMPHPTLDTGIEWIELYNTTNAPKVLAGWYISDQSNNLQMFPIPAGTIIPAKGYVTFTDRQYQASGLGFQEEINTVYLTEYVGGVAVSQDVKTYGPPDGDAAAAGVLYGVDHDVSFGRYKKSDGDSEFVALSAQTYNGPNAYPAAGRIVSSEAVYPIVISEVMYHPGAAGVGITDEYIELYNRGNSRVVFYDPADQPSPAPWKLFSGIDANRVVQGVTWTFNTLGSYLDPGQYALVVGVAPATFRTKYNIPQNVSIFGPWTSPTPGNALSNSGERITLMKPETGDHDSPGGATPYYFVDCVKYKDTSPWPTQPDVDGAHYSLTRAAPALWGDEALSWGAATPTPGAANAPVAARATGRYLFYKGSAYAATGDNAAIANDKDALLPGKKASFNNYSTYDRGINGIMVDIAGLKNTEPPTAIDFLVECRMGNDSNPSGWLSVPPLTITPIAGGGAGGTTRVVLTWADGAIRNKWLRVSISATGIGMTTADVFYFGNLVGDVGNAAVGALSAVVDAGDELDARTHKTGFTLASITDDQDFNRDGHVNATDDIIARDNSGASLVLFTTAPAAGATAAGAAVSVATAPAASASIPRATAVPVAVTSEATAARSQASPLLRAAAKSEKARDTLRGWEWVPWIDVLAQRQRSASQRLVEHAADHLFARWERFFAQPL